MSVTEEVKQLYFLQLKINIGIQGGIDLPGAIIKVNALLCSYSTATTCLHKYKEDFINVMKKLKFPRHYDADMVHPGAKEGGMRILTSVTGEPRLIAVFEVSNVIGLERTLSGLARLGYIDVVHCQPLLRYQDFAQMLEVDESLLQSLDNTLADVKQLIWFEFSIEYPGKSTEELLDTWKKEAITALGARASKGLELFKVVGERKVHVFLALPHAVLDKMSFNLPLMKENGNGVTIVSRGLQHLDDYTSRISTESL